MENGLSMRERERAEITMREQQANAAMGEEHGILWNHRSWGTNIRGFQG